MKAYWIAQVDVNDPQQYTQYTQRGPAAFKLYGGRFLARGGRSEAVEGKATPQRTVIIEFDSYDQAVACYNSPEYQDAMSYRAGAARAEIVIVEGI
ncbi:MULTISPECIES: DUF1330 domain-containing protein [Pseudomonas]|uniref:DUF1330 domain-containing protein n=1 Tax=Pseudomonas TaxID=286 RepID=UPI0003F61623|nr:MULTISPECIES: DUF1330 domain-containing protein [Pseudomonas]MCQ2993481.1 DUF1330 domain-containing protein [Pseudomonas syringae]RMR06378.1 hypothetical protein ALP94_02054 [Pseudomonas savastanoi pv. glycinea]MCD5975009.1 DUF1330 domain-containing protein [Pseudomonas quasicaspiana]MCD5979936.1 DUF1330 domain-containing protein [Pseudomonas quasicaspiana]MCD5991939.1 DUF1330 domain-containing protein [Pseudomonas quasicaspiana]